MNELGVMEDYNGDRYDMVLSRLLKPDESERYVLVTQEDMTECVCVTYAG